MFMGPESAALYKNIIKYITPVSQVFYICFFMSTPKPEQQGEGNSEKCVSRYVFKIIFYIMCATFLLACICVHWVLSLVLMEARSGELDSRN